MEDYFDLCMTTPHSEKCAQVGDENYMKNAKLEIRAYIDLLARTFGAPPDGSWFKTIRCNHDFGPYLDIRFYYDDEVQAHVDYLAKIECGVENWDEIAVKELRAGGYEKLTIMRTIPSHKAA